MAKDNKKISILDVAKYAGVSAATVSRVINNSDHPVNSNTRQVVLEAIDDLNFQPNRMAQNLKKNRSNIIGVIVHDISDEYFSEMLKGIEEVTFNYDYIINILNTNRDILKELRAVSMLSANLAEAIVFTGGSLRDDYYNQEMKSHIKRLKANDCLIISITTHPFEIKNINIGNKLAGRTITDYLLNKGHYNIAYLNGPEILYTTKERVEGYKEALTNRGIAVREEMIVKGDFSFEGGRKAAVSIMEYVDEISAVVAANDESALGLIWELNRRGINVPGDISVVGIGNIPASKYSYPPLTTISIPLYELGKKIGNYIISQLKDDGIAEDIDVQIGLIERKSVKDLNDR